MKIGFLGAGSWGFCLASLLASKGYQTISWTRDAQLAERLSLGDEHPFLRGHAPRPGMQFTIDLAQALQGADLLVESVTSAGLRPVFEQIRQIKEPSCPIVITSKGIEQNSGLILPEVLLDLFGPSVRQQIACLSGPSYAIEVIRELPTLVVISAYNRDLLPSVCELFSLPTFRVYPNEDLTGVSYGGALKNIIAIACGIAEGLGMGHSTKAALMTRGLHEIHKFAVAQGCRTETLMGLSGMGDLCLTCSSLISRNSRFGYLLAKGYSPEKAQTEIGMVVEGSYTCVSALQLSKQRNIPMPISEVVYKIIYEGMSVQAAVQVLMERSVKHEHL